LAELETQLELAISLELLSNMRAMSDTLLEADRVLQGLIKGVERKVAAKLR